jgi:hypothetical protein
MNGDSFIACDSSMPYMPLSVGEHTFVVKAFDAAGAEGNELGHQERFAASSTGSESYRFGVYRYPTRAGSTQ